MIHVIGIGPGSKDYLTDEARRQIQVHPVIIGVERQLETVKTDLSPDAVAIPYNGRLDALKNCIENHINQPSLGILASGDPSFYGITEWLKRTFDPEKIVIHPGISSTQLLFAKTKTPMHDFYMTSLHGRTDALESLDQYQKLCLLTDKICSPYFIAKHFLERGQNPKMIIGESLSYDDECITEILASEIEDRDYKMSVVIVIHER